MAVGPKTFPINCAGGLNLTATPTELFQNPGYAIELVNYESNNRGGYRRINGYTRGDTDTRPSGAVNPIVGVSPYADGVVAVQSTAGGNFNIYFSTDRVTWIQVNKSMTYATGLDSTALAAAASTSRAVAGRAEFVVFQSNTDYGELVITDGANDMAVFKIEDTGGSRTYHYTELSTPGAVQWCEVYKDRLVVGGSPTLKNSVYWSHTNDPTDFVGANAGSIVMPSNVNGIKVWRDRLFVFGEYNIDEISGLVSGAPGSATVNNVSRNVGCLDGFSIQEIGGDLVYLSVDGMRTLSGTDQIDDINLGNISRKIDPIMERLIADLSIYDITSFVLRDRNQYRLFYCNSSESDDEQRGIIGTIKRGPEGLRWEWSEIHGIPVSSGYSGVVQRDEMKYHGGYDGYVYDHDSGLSFNGASIGARYTTPEIDFGNLAVRHTLHWMKIHTYNEGKITDLRINTRFNFSDTSMTINPGATEVPDFGGLSVFGEATYGTSLYGGGERTESFVNMIGAGFSASFQFYTESVQAGYTLYSFLIKFHDGMVQ